MTQLDQLIAQREALDKQIQATRNAERQGAIAQIRSLMAQFEISSSELGGAATGRKKSSRAGVRVAPKYRDPATGKTWTGRGVQPKWLEGKDRSQYLI